jgi:hypothetical protein
MFLDTCKSCENYILSHDCYVICNFSHVQEKRMTDKTKKGIIYIVNCPKKVNVKR